MNIHKLKEIKLAIEKQMPHQPEGKPMCFTDYHYQFGDNIHHYCRFLQGLVPQYELYYKDEDGIYCVQNKKS